MSNDVISKSKVSNKNQVEKEIMKESVSQPEDATQMMALSDIKINDDFRCRVQDDADAIEAYEEKFKEYKMAKMNGPQPDYPFPPVTVWLNKNGGYTLIAGYHRFQAANKADMGSILVKIFRGTEKEALWLAMKDNNKNGLRLSYGDTKYCIEKALRHFKKTPGAIAKEIGCHRSYAYRIEKELSTSRQLTQTETRIGIDEKEYPTKRKKATKQPNTKTREKSDSNNAIVQPSKILEATAKPVVDFPAKSRNSLLETVDEPFDFGDTDEPEKTEKERMDEFIASLDAFVQTLTGRNKDYGFYHRVIDWLCRNKMGDMLRVHEINKQTKFIS